MSRRKLGAGKFARAMSGEVRASEVFDAEVAVAQYALARDISSEQAFDELLAMGVSRAAALDRHYAQRRKRAVKARGGRRSKRPPRRRPRSGEHLTATA